MTNEIQYEGGETKRIIQKEEEKEKEKEKENTITHKTKIENIHKLPKKFI